jgi:hypothetical protein
MRLAVIAFVLLTAVGCAGSPSPADSVDTRPIEEVNASWADGQWAPSARSLWSYTEDHPEPTGEVSQVWKDSTWVNDVKQTWEVEATGRRTGQTIFIWRDGAWDLSSRGQIRYDGDGNRIAERRGFVGGPLAGAVDSLVWIRSPDGRTVERRFYRRAGAEVAEFARQRTEYDADGREVMRAGISNLDGQWTEDYRRTHTYRPDGQKERSRIERWRSYDDAWEHTGNEVYTYDERGRLIFLVYELRDHAVRDSVAWYPFRRTETRYAE